MADARRVRPATLDMLANARDAGWRGTDKRPLRHLCRFLLLGLYTGSRPGAIFNATWDRGPGRSWVDVERGVFHRHADGTRETDKRQPTGQAFAAPCSAHMRRWKRLDGGGPWAMSSPTTGQPIRRASRRRSRAPVSSPGLKAASPPTRCATPAASWLVAKGHADAQDRGVPRERPSK